MEKPKISFNDLYKKHTGKDFVPITNVCKIKEADVYRDFQKIINVKIEREREEKKILKEKGLLPDKKPPKVAKPVEVKKQPKKYIVVKYDSRKLAKLSALFDKKADIFFHRQTLKLAKSSTGIQYFTNKLGINYAVDNNSVIGKLKIIDSTTCDDLLKSDIIWLKDNHIPFTIPMNMNIGLKTGIDEKVMKLEGDDFNEEDEEETEEVDIDWE